MTQKNSGTPAPLLYFLKKSISNTSPFYKSCVGGHSTFYNDKQDEGDNNKHDGGYDNNNGVDNRMHCVDENLHSNEH